MLSNSFLKAVELFLRWKFFEDKKIDNFFEDAVITEILDGEPSVVEPCA